MNIRSSDVAGECGVARTSVLPGIGVFGGMGVTGADGPVAVRGPRQRRLLMLLVLRSGSVASADWLTEYLWHTDERPEAPGAQLRTCVSRLRRALPQSMNDWIRTDGSGYRLDAPANSLEHRRFTQLRAEATDARRHSNPTLALRLLDEALALWRGEPFEELDDCSVAAAEVEQLRTDRLEMLEERWECSLALGRHTQITGELAAFTSQHQFRCRATRQYALALHRSGRTAEALRAVAGHRRFLLNESGLEPSAEMLELEQAMLLGDSSLEADTSTDSLPGYRLLEEIGVGAFSIVRRGTQLRIGRDVAIKQIRPELACQPDFMGRFETEAQLIARVEHPHVVPLIDFWRDSGSAYLVMGLLRGGTLEDRLSGGLMSVEDTLALARQIGGALSAAHGRGIIHRDVKPGNIMFDEADNAFLGDFGIALDIGDSVSPAAVFSTGSPAYSAPEQANGELLGVRSDVFSLGIVLFECFSGAPPAANVGTEPAQVEKAMVAHASVHIARAVARATAANPVERFASVADFVKALLQDTTPAPQPMNSPVRLRGFSEPGPANFVEVCDRQLLGYAGQHN